MLLALPKGLLSKRFESSKKKLKRKNSIKQESEGSSSESIRMQGCGGTSSYLSLPALTLLRCRCSTAFESKQPNTLRQRPTTSSLIQSISYTSLTFSLDSVPLSTTGALAMKLLSLLSSQENMSNRDFHLIS